MSKINTCFTFIIINSLFFMSCVDPASEEDSGSEIYDYTEIVETTDKGEILKDYTEQWQPRMVWQPETDSTDNNIGNMPTDFDVYPAYPNPFRDSTLIKYTLPHASFISITLEKETDNSKTTIYSDNQSAGNYSYALNSAEIDTGFYRIEISNSEEVLTFGFIQRVD